MAPILLTFTAANWQTAQIVSLSAINDALFEGAEGFTVTVTATSIVARQSPDARDGDGGAE